MEEEKGGGRNREILVPVLAYVNDEKRKKGKKEEKGKRRNNEKGEGRNRRILVPVLVYVKGDLKCNVLLKLQSFSLILTTEKPSCVNGNSSSF